MRLKKHRAQHGGSLPAWPTETAPRCQRRLAPHPDTDQAPESELRAMPKRAGAPLVGYDNCLSLHPIIPTPHRGLEAPVTQAYMDKFLITFREKIGSLKTKFKSCLQVVRRDVDGLDERLNDMDQTVDTKTEEMRCSRDKSQP
ncbi:hypothetical protein NDU88_002203 [Pleurodeles waltl]|uniref:Uncharacterized protein n=1 Tax=Pleurodeles waltl TaxID=8319 RepID=A0AAV7VDX7_PLEWA|nr:hypothetical protein NDU88_002203 [Pleurodeles waltl]